MNAELVDIDDPRVVKALAHPIRMKILNILDGRTATPKELAEHLGLPLENVSYHVRTLKEFGFIKLERTRQVRGAVEHHYRLAGRPRVGSKLWEEVPRVVREALLDANLSATVDGIGRAAVEGGFDRNGAQALRHSLVLDEEGFKEAAAIIEDAARRIEAVAGKAQQRVRDGEATRVTASFFLFETRPVVPDPEGPRDGNRHSRTEKSSV